MSSQKAKYNLADSLYVEKKIDKTVRAVKRGPARAWPAVPSKNSTSADRFPTKELIGNIRKSLDLLEVWVNKKK